MNLGMYWRIEAKGRAALGGLGFGEYGCRKVLTFAGKSKFLEFRKHVSPHCLAPGLVSGILICRTDPFRIRGKACRGLPPRWRGGRKARRQARSLRFPSLSHTLLPKTSYLQVTAPPTALEGMAEAQVCVCVFDLQLGGEL